MTIESRKAKLFLSRDVHSELTRKIIGKSHGDRFLNGELHRPGIYFPDLYQTIDSGIEEILRLELMQMSIPGLPVTSTTERKLPSKVHELASLQAELLREEKEKPVRTSDSSENLLNHASNGHSSSTSNPSILKDDHGLSLELHHNSSFSSGTPTDNWSPFTHYGSNDSYEREFFPGISTTIREASTSGPRPSSGRNPLVAKRNSNIDRMLNEIAQRSSKNHSPKVPGDPTSTPISTASVTPAPSRFSFFLPSTPEKNSCLTPPGSAIGGIASSQPLPAADATALPVPPAQSYRLESSNRRHSNVDKFEKRFATLFPNRSTQPKSPVPVQSIHVLSRSDRIAYHQNLSRKLTQNIIKSSVKV